ncbi:MAG: hypothetical protein Q9167_003888 [Letrouitia subvulpina]
MFYRHGLLVALLLSLLSFALCEVDYQEEQELEAQSDLEEFNRLLDQVDPPSLHAALHDYSPKKFKHGMFKEDKTAVKAIHRDEPSLASTIVSLAKRQEVPSNSTGPTSAPAPASSPETPATPAPEPSPPEPSPTEPSPTDENPTPPSPPPNVATPVPVGPGSSALVDGGSPISQPTLAPGVPTEPPEVVPSTGASPETGGGSENLPTIAPTNPSPTGGATGSSLTEGEVITTTNAAGVTIVSTVGGGYVTLGGGSSISGSSSHTTSSSSTRRRTSSTSLVLQTTTLPNGSQSTVTAVTVVAGGGDEGSTPTGTAGAAGGTSAGGSPALQTGIAVRTGKIGVEILCLLGGAVGVAMMM